MSRKSYESGTITIHIMDDAETLIRRRDLASDQVYASLTNVVNFLLDDADEKRDYPLVIVLTTNYATQLDGALLRRAEGFRALSISGPTKEIVAAFLKKEVQANDLSEVKAGQLTLDQAVSQITEACFESVSPTGAVYEVVIPKTRNWESEGRMSPYVIEQILRAISEGPTRTDEGQGNRGDEPSRETRQVSDKWQPPKTDDEFRALALKCLRCIDGAADALSLVNGAEAMEGKRKAPSKAVVRPCGESLTVDERGLNWHHGDQHAKQFLWALAQAKGFIPADAGLEDGKTKFPGLDLARALAPNGKEKDEDNARRLRYLFGY